MNSLEHSPCRPTGFDEYDCLSGYVTATYTREWTDARGTRWREIDSRPNRHGARWQHYCSCASEDDARSVLVRLEKDTSQEPTL